jgi:uncharacterized protein (DUF433 family)
MSVSKKSRQALVHGRDLRETPLYSLAEVAHHVHVPRATLRSWVQGRDYVAAGGLRHSPRVLVRPDPEDERFSFNNLIEAHVLRALRTRHGVPMNMVRGALAYAEAEHGIERLLIHDELEAAPGEIFLREYGRLLSLNHSGQFAIERVLRGFLRRVVRDAKGLPVRLYPFVAPGVYDDRKVIAIDPRLAYGRPSIESRGISTAILAERRDAGETIDELAESYGLDQADVEEAILYEARAA